MSGDKDGLLYWPKFFLDHNSTSFASWLGLLNRGSLRAQSPLSAAGSHFGILSRTAWAPGYIIFYRPSAFAVLPLIYTGASPDWRLCRGSIYNTIFLQLKHPTTCDVKSLSLYTHLFIIQTYSHAENTFQINSCSNQVQGPFLQHLLTPINISSIVIADCHF